MTVDDLVTGRAAQELGDGVFPTTAILVVATTSLDGHGLRYLIADADTPQYVAIGALRSVLHRLEADDLAAWDDDDLG